MALQGVDMAGLCQVAAHTLTHAPRLQPRQLLGVGEETLVHDLRVWVRARRGWNRGRTVTHNSHTTYWHLKFWNILKYLEAHVHGFRTGVVVV